MTLHPLAGPSQTAPGLIRTGPLPRPAVAAAREAEEETGWRPRRMDSMPRLDRRPLDFGRRPAGRQPPPHPPA
ncbi:NUDIX domain-containing protein [Actinoplanes auranticolor]|uniref:NUDIX domain-containing protein n=1 Tax=Actinoplanes auranticolor TaxID=47988 RepID=UPI0034DAD44A